jgi:hypothetical protein
LPLGPTRPFQASALQNNKFMRFEAFMFVVSFLQHQFRN